MQHLLGAAGFTATFNAIWDDTTDTAKYNFDVAVGLGDPDDTSCGAKSWESLLTGKVWT